MEKLILIDGNAIIHRAFHALPPLTNKKGEIANAVYGFFAMFLKIIEEQKPSYLAVCFDRPKPTFRKQLFAGYQAKRPKTAEDLLPQIKIVHEVLAKAKISIFEIDGYEADDLIGTLANKAISKSKFMVHSRKGSEDKSSHEPSTMNHQPIEVVIVSGDRDMLQLVNSKVKVLAPVTGITKMILFDENSVEEKYGIKPRQIVDYKALVGDASDNYPGVKGIGPKTASALLKEYETLENIYGKLGGLAEKNQKLAQKLAEGVEQAGLAKKLAQITVEAPITFDIKKCSMNLFDKEGIREAFEGLGFSSLLKRLKENGKNATTENTETKRGAQKDNGQMDLL